MYRCKASAHSPYEREQGENAMQLEGITWHALTLQADEFGPTKKLLIEVFGLRPAIEEDGYTTFPMSDGGMVFGFRVDDIEAASEELAEAGCELLGEITGNEQMNYRYRDFRGPDGRVYGINERK